MVCLQTSFSDLKMIRVFTGKNQRGKSTCQCNDKIMRVARLFTSSSILKKCVEIQCLSPLFVLFSYSSYDGLRTRVYTSVVLPILITASDSSLAESNCQLA